MEYIQNNVAVMADDARIQDQISKCPFVQHNMNTKSGREEAMDLTFTAQAVLQGIANSPLGGVLSITTCVSVCLSTICPLLFLKNHASEFYEVYTCYLRP